VSQAGAATARAPAAAISAKKDDPNTIGLITSVWIRAAHHQRGEDHATRPEADRADGAASRAVFAVRSDSPFKKLRDSSTGEGRRLAQAVGRPVTIADKHGACRCSTPPAPGGRSVSFPRRRRLAALLGGQVDTW